MGEFCSRHWGKAPFVGTISDDQLAALAEELSGFDVPSLIAAHSSKVSIWFDDMDGRFQAVDLAPKDARRLYSAGHSAYLPDISTPSLDEWRDVISQALGRHQTNYLCSLFASHPGNMTACHFDHIENFTIQLRGKKTWRIAKNASFANCTVNYSVAAARAHHEELWLYAPQPLPGEMPEPYEEVVLHPGSVLYVPRGYWHEVVSSGDDQSLSLLIAFPALTWTDAVLPALRTLLLRREMWRDNAAFSVTDPVAHEEKLASLWQDLREVIESADARRLLPPYGLGFESEDGGVYRRNPLCSLGRYPVDDLSLDLVAQLHLGELSRAAEARVPSRWAELLVDIETAADTIREDVLRHRFPDIAEEVPTLLSVLCRLQVLQPDLRPLNSTAGVRPRA